MNDYLFAIIGVFIVGTILFLIALPTVLDKKKKK